MLTFRLHMEFTQQTCDEAAAVLRILAVIELAAGPPAVEIDDVTSRRGFELVEEILGSAPAERTELGMG